MFYQLKRSIQKGLSYFEFNLKQNYKLARQLSNMTSRAPFSFLYSIWDYEISHNGNVIPVRLFSDNDSKSDAVIIYFHGGGWVIGNIESYTKTCASLAKSTGYRVLSVDYRLAPEHKFPAGLTDCYTVVNEIIKNANELGINKEKIVVMGDSAGGNLAAAVNLMLQDNRSEGVKKQILIYPSTAANHGLKSGFESLYKYGVGQILTVQHINDYIDLYKNSDWDLDNPYFAPLLAESLSGQPETLIITAELDPLRDEAEAYGKKLTEAGNYTEIYRIQNACHGFFSASPSEEPDVLKCYEIINKFLNR